MKPVSPDERELEALAAEVAAHYRNADEAQPPSRLDAAILEAARREARRPTRRNWHLPASIAAMLVIGVSLALMTSEIEDPLPPPDPGPAGRVGETASGAGVERPPAERRPGVAAKARPDGAEAQFDSLAGERLTRERSSREQAVPAYRAPPPAGPERDAAAALPGSETAIRAPEAPATGALSRRETATDVELQERLAGEPAAQSGAEAAASGPEAAPEDWLKRIEQLLREGRTAEAQQELARFGERYPNHPLPQALRPLRDRPER